VTTKAGYWIGGALICCGVVGAILWGVAGFLRIDDTVGAFQRLPIPGARTLSLPADKVVVYVEGPGVDERAPSIGVAVTAAHTGAEVPVASYGASLTYSFGTSGVAIATVTPPRAGRYVVRADFDSAGRHVVRSDFGGAGRYNLALGESIAGGIVGAILGAFAVGGAFALAGTGLIAATSIRRSRRRVAGRMPPSPFGS
jgi:hypothetical protein